MRITIDYTPALRQGAGIGRYTRGLVDALAKEDAQDKITLFCAGEHPQRQAWPANFQVRVAPVSSRWLTYAWHRARVPVPAEWLAGSSDIFHSPDYALPPLRRARGVVTVHDLSFLRMPEVADPGLRAYLTKAVPHAVRRAAHVLADSAHTKRDLQELLGVEPSRVTVVPCGVGERFRPVSDDATLRRVQSHYGLPDRFVLFLGTLEPRKNLSRLISAFALARRNHALLHRLVIAGRPGWLYQDIYDRVELEKMGDAVQFLGYTEDKDLPALYSLADAFAFPTLYEGFGLPPLEAMACGTPVVTSNNSSLPEAVGDAALLVNAEDVDQIAHALTRIIEDSELRERLQRTGRARAARFTWKAAVTKLREAYLEAMRT